MPDTPQVTVRTTEAGRVTEVVVPSFEGMARVRQLILIQVPRADIGFTPTRLGIRQPGGPDVVALAGETLRIAAGRVVRIPDA